MFGSDAKTKPGYSKTQHIATPEYNTTPSKRKFSPTGSLIDRMWRLSLDGSKTT